MAKKRVILSPLVFFPLYPLHASSLKAPHVVCCAIAPRLRGAIVALYAEQAVSLVAQLCFNYLIAS